MCRMAPQVKAAVAEAEVNTEECITDNAGLYSSDVIKFGLIQRQLFRVSRLPGVHVSS